MSSAEQQESYGSPIGSLVCGGLQDDNRVLTGWGGGPCTIACALILLIARLHGPRASSTWLHCLGPAQVKGSSCCSRYA
jgi:hypothetical protein